MEETMLKCSNRVLFFSVPIDTRRRKGVGCIDKGGTIVVYNFKLSDIGNIYLLPVRFKQMLTENRYVYSC